MRTPKTPQSHSARIKILYTLGIALAITAILGTAFNPNQINIVKTETVLLNPKYAPLVSLITLSREQTNENLSIERTRNGYKGISGELIFPADTVKATELIAKARNTLILYEISDSYDAWNSLSIDDTAAIVVSFWGPDNLASQNTTNSPLTQFSRLYFGSEDFSLSQITVRTALSPNVYRTQNDFYAFLTFSPSAWADPKLIPDYLKNSQTKDNLVSVSLIENDANGTRETKLFAGDTIFPDATQSLFSLQSSNIIPIPHYISTQNTAPELQVTATFQGNHTATFTAYAQNNTHIIVPTSNELRYALEISEWTYQNILDAFKGK